MISSALIDRSRRCRDRNFVEIAIWQNENMLLITVLTTFCDQNVQHIISLMSIDNLGSFKPIGNIKVTGICNIALKLL